MGACATKPGDLKAKGEAPVVVEEEDASAPPAGGGDKAKDGGVPPPAAEADPAADASRRRSLSDLLREDAEASDAEAGHQDEAEKVVVTVDEEPASAADDDGEAREGSRAAPVQAPVASEAEDVVAAGDQLDGERRSGRELGGGEHAAEEEKRVDPGSVQVLAAAVPSADDASSA